jgi:hypothetical protein
MSVTGWTPRERRWLVFLLVAAVLFGGLVEFRSAFLHRRMGDLDVFLRAAWAVRSGRDIYTVTDDKGFHYHYPPLFAILLTPLADPPAGADRAWTLPYAVSVALWYAFSVACLIVAIRWLAAALDEGGRPWSALRIVPLVACLPAIGGSLMRGQVDLLLLLLLCGMTVAALERRSFAAGMWLAAAIALKVIPAYLLIYPLWRRDGRWLAGCAAGLAVFLGVIPAAVFGPKQTIAYYQEWQTVLLRPALTQGGDQTRANELTNVTATDSQSFLAVLHNTLHPDRTTRPPTAAVCVRLTHWAIGGELTLLLLMAGRRARGPAVEVLRLGNLMILMILLSPVCHLHYFALLLPAATGLVALDTQRELHLSGWLKTVFVILIVANSLPKIPGLELLRDAGLAMYAALLLWGTGCFALWKMNDASPRAAARESAVLTPPWQASAGRARSPLPR